MSCECDDKFLSGSRNWLICTGQANLPTYKINAYRQRWGLTPFPLEYGEPTKAEPLDYDPVPEVVFHGYSVSQGAPPVIKKVYGPGTELLRIYEAAGVPTCDACKELVQQMNNWGVAECRKRHEQIVDDIFPRAKEWVAQNMPWTHALLPGCVEDYGIYQRISSDVVKAIDEAERVIVERREKKLDVYTGERRKGCGACG